MHFAKNWLDMEGRKWGLNLDLEGQMDPIAFDIYGAISPDYFASQSHSE